MKAIFKIFPAAGGQFSAVNYSAKKVDDGSAKLLLFKNFGMLEMQDVISKNEFTKYLIDWSARSNRIRHPVFHAVLSTEGYSLPHEQLKDMAEEIMKGLGYADNPLLIYAHSDTENAHVHIVTSRVGISGKKINDGFEGKRANQLLNNILKRNPNEEFKICLDDALRYKIDSEPQFLLLMEQKGYDVSMKGGEYVFISTVKNKEL